MPKNVNEEYSGKSKAPSTEELKARAIANYAGDTAKKATAAVLSAIIGSFL